MEKKLRNILQRYFRSLEMNFSGNLYTIEELKLLNSNQHYKIMLISASDKFGDYGIVGWVSYLWFK